MNGTDTGGGQISAREILTVIFRRKVPIIICTVAIAAATLTAASRTASVYQATAKILLRRMGATPLATTWTPFYGLEEEMNTEVELITTEPVLERAVTKLKEKGVYIHIASGDTEITREPTIGDLRAGVSATPVEMSNIILVRFTGSDPHFVSEAANAIAEAYVEHRIQLRKAGSTVDFFQDQLRSLEDRLLSLKQQELALRKQGGIYDLEWQYRVAISRKSELETKLAEVRSQRIAEERKLKLIKQRLAEDPDLLTPFPDFVKDRLGGQMLSEYWSLRKKRDELAATLTESNPRVRMLDEQIAKMKERFHEEIQRRIKEKEFLLEDLRAEEKGYEETIEEISRQLQQTPEIVAEIEHLQKEIYYTYFHYDKVLEKMLDSMASEANDIRISNAKLISPARAQLTKAGKMRTVYVAFSVLLGVTFGIGFGFLLENLDHSVKSAADIEENIGVTLLGSIPESSKLAKLTRNLGQRHKFD